MRKAHIAPGVAILTILLSSSGEYASVIGHYMARFDGVVVARKSDVHYPLWTRNRTTRYEIRESDGQQRVYYADPSQGHIDGFPLGTRLSKQRWHMDYAADGKTRNDFPFPIYFFWMVLDFVLLVAGVILAVMMRSRDRQTRELEAAVQRGERLLRDEDREPEN